MDPNVVLKRFFHTPDTERSSPSDLSGSDWRQMGRLVCTAVKDAHQHEAKKLSSSLHHLSVQVELLRLENEGVRDTLTTKKKHKNKSKNVDLQ
jgi:hypothetical protein